MEGKRYCIFCGSLLETDAGICPSCKKKIPEKDSPFREYLLRNTKEKLKEKVEDTVFSALKNWILSHLYGVVVSLLIVGIIAVNLFSPSLPLYIEDMSSPRRPGEQQSYAAEESGTEAQEQHGSSQNREDRQAVINTVHSFEHAVFYELLMSETGDPGGLEEPEKPSADYFLPLSYGVAIGNEFYYAFGYKATYTDIDYEGITWNHPATDTGQKLLADGYDVAEVHAVNVYKDDRSDESPAVRSDPFMFVLVKADGNWYIAEILATG